MSVFVLRERDRENAQVTTSDLPNTHAGHPHCFLTSGLNQVLCHCGHGEASMADNKFLTAEEVSERYRGEITVGTLRNWRAMRIGPAFVKIGKAVLYPVRELDAWDQKNLVICDGSRSGCMDEREGGR